jgi:ATP-dependent DNA helicase RecQ
MNRYKQILARYWDYSEFRYLQLEIIESVAAGKDTLGLMPTGGGKSITFQVYSLSEEGICIVITPLIALMKDQVQNLLKKGIKALKVHSGMSPHEIKITLDNAVWGDYKFLYVSPERLNSEMFRERLKKMKVNLVTVDEAHCISQWGYDFRPSYMNIIQLRELLPGIKFLALFLVFPFCFAHKLCPNLLPFQQYSKDTAFCFPHFEPGNLGFRVEMKFEAHFFH